MSALLERVREGLGEGYSCSDGGSYHPKWREYTINDRINLVADAITLLEQGEELKESEVASLRKCYESTLSGANRQARRDPCFHDRRPEVQILGLRLSRVLSPIPPIPVA